MTDEAPHASAPPGPGIWVDADACPVVVKEILYRAAMRTCTRVTLVANQALSVPPSPWIRAIQVPRGFDVADNHIVAAIGTGELAVTADLPLAAAVVDKGAEALNPRGEHYHRGNVRELLDLRNFMDTLRSAGMQTGGPPAFGQADRQRFAGQLDRWLAARRR